MSVLIVPNIICFQTQKWLTILNNIGLLPKGVLIYLRACNFVHAITSLRAHCTHAHHCVRNLSSSVWSLSKTLWYLLPRKLWKSAIRSTFCLQFIYQTFMPNPIQSFWHIWKSGVHFQRRMVTKRFINFVNYRQKLI